MTMKYIQKFPAVEEILHVIPLPQVAREVKESKDREIADIMTGKDSRLLIAIGPCSAHQEDAVYEYVTRLAKLQEKVKERLLLMPRVYTNKPRTTGAGYKGMMHQPDVSKEPDMAKGLRAIRTMHIKVLSDTGLPVADEMLYPGNYPYLEDVLSYVAVGARSVENQEHRLTVSGLNIPIGMKNPTSGDLRVMLDSIFAAQSAHVFIYNGWEVSTSGNPLAHAVIRGAVDHTGKNISNYHYEDLIGLADMYKKREMENPAIIVDTNHSNSAKKYREQPRIAMEVMRSKVQSPLLKKMVKGFMIESYLLDGSQPVDGTEFGKSITDPCLGWEDSYRLIMDLAESA